MKVAVRKHAQRVIPPKWLGKIAMARCAIQAAASLVLIAAVICPAISQSNPDLETFFRENVGLSQDQIDAIGSGQPIVKPSRRVCQTKSYCLAQSTSMLLRKMLPSPQKRCWRRKSVQNKKQATPVV